jgi:hypothetical protein
MSDDPNLDAIASSLGRLVNEEPEEGLLNEMMASSEAVVATQPKKLVGGVDSSDNLLLNIPYHPGAAVAGYSFALVLVDGDGQNRHVIERMTEKQPSDVGEDLEIALVYNTPNLGDQKALHIADYQFGLLVHTPQSRSPYMYSEPLGEFKVRLVAARHRETTERRAVRTALYQPDVDFDLLLKDGRHSSQNVSTRYTDDVGRRAVEQRIRYVGVVKKGTLLWSRLYAFHRKLYEMRKGAYWTIIPPKIIWETYTGNQADAKTLKLGARENQSLGGIGGAWVMYGSNAGGFYILEFNVYDMSEYHHLVDSNIPLEIYNRDQFGWTSGTYVAHEKDGSYIGTQTRISIEDKDQLIGPTVNEIHHMSQLSRMSPGYPLVLAEAHNRCKITKDRKDRLNLQLVSQLRRQGFEAVDFETWTEDPHKIFEN